MQGRWAGIGLALGLAAAYLAACLWWVANELVLVLPHQRAIGSLGLRALLGPAVSGPLAAFAAVLLAIHALLGLAAFGLARLTEAAAPQLSSARRHWLIAGWFALLVGLVMAANATWHGSSMFSSETSWWRGEVLGVAPVVLLAALVASLVLWLAARALRSRQRRFQISRLAVPSAVLAVIGTAAALAAALDQSAAAPVASRPHVVILGIDSLRGDLEIPRLGHSATPHVRDFLAGAVQFEDAITPLARTYPSWVSILTGRHPVSTNARFNLMPRGLVQEGDTLADALRADGYRTIYATDEVRFANFDGSFGFDQLIMPPVGAADFLLGYGGDIPLVNLIAGLPVGARLFPSNHANRAYHVTYQPWQFLRRLERELRIDQPAFIAIHLTLAHWPYSWGGAQVPSGFDEYRAAYGRAVESVDEQFARVMELLAREGVLDNAIVVLLSDHGEALGADNDSMLRNWGSDRELWDSLWGHGTSVLSPHQYRVLLAMRSYGHARAIAPPGRRDWPISLEDLRPTLEQYVTGRAPSGTDGVSLLPYLREAAPAGELSSRVRFTETDFNPVAVLAGRYDATGIVDEAAEYYELDPASGWLQFRSERVPEQLQLKQRAALSARSLLAALPQPGGTVRYLFTDRLVPAPRILDGPPPPTDPEAARLWDALRKRFPGEVP